jgi:hypothetical protein
VKVVNSFKNIIPAFFKPAKATLSGWLFVLLIFCRFTAQAQTGSGQLSITLSAKTITVEEALQEVQKQAGVKFSYSSDALPLQQKITLSGKENTVETALQVIFKGTGITWLYRPDQILLFPENASSSASKSNAASTQSKYTISGYVRELGSQEALIAVTVFAPEIKAGLSTNNYGFYSITLPADSVTLHFSYVGYKTRTLRLNLDKDLPLNVDLSPEGLLKEVEIVAEKDPAANQVAQMSQITVPVAQVKDMPALLGEKDVLRAVQLLPGVQKGGEGQTGLYVRGGGPDQNLIILDDATVYDSQHLFGFFSLFNGDAIKSISLTKGGFPARYGGRLSSVLEMNMKDGNQQEFHGEGGIGLIASRLVLEGPIKKNKASFLVSVRRTYFDFLMNALLPDNLQAGYYFADGNAKVNYDFGRKDKLYVSGYYGRDKFYFDAVGPESRSNIAVAWGNITTTARWNHLFNDRLFANTSLIFSQYRFSIGSRTVMPNALSTVKYFSGIRDLTLKSDLDFYPSASHYVKVGATATWHYFTPSVLRMADSGSNFSQQSNQTLNSLENAVYAEDQLTLKGKLLVNSGLRLSYFYAQGRSYFNPEPRLSLAYRLTSRTTLKASMAAMNQFVHLLSTTGTGLPIDLWLPSTDRVRPQQAWQAAAGVARQLFSDNVTLEVEGYYKKSRRILAYRNGASFLTINDPDLTDSGQRWEDNVTAGQAWSYGLEFLLQKKTGNFTGWIGYTLSHTQQQFDELNQGEKFDARYDRRHDIAVTASYAFSAKVKCAASWVYGTGNAITLPLSEYAVSEHTPATNPFAALGYTDLVGEYGARNNYRMPAFHHLDIALQLTKQLRYFQRTWEVSVYNAYNRRNPYYYTLSSRNDQRVMRQMHLFPLIPSVSYNLKF